MKATDPHLFCFGLGFSGQALARLALARGWRVSGTVRSQAKAARLQEQGIDALVLDTDAADQLPDDLIEAIERSSHLLQSVGTARSGDDPILPLLAQAAEVTASGWSPDWFGYLSTTVVMATGRGLGQRRQRDPQHLDPWTGAVARRGRSGPASAPQRSGAARVPPRRDLRPRPERAGNRARRQARIIDKPDQVFSRIHVEDIATAVFASMTAPTAAVGAAEVFNVCDDEPCPTRDRGCPCLRSADQPVPDPGFHGRGGAFGHGTEFLCGQQARVEPQATGLLWLDPGLPDLPRRPRGTAARRTSTPGRGRQLRLSLTHREDGATPKTGNTIARQHRKPRNTEARPEQRQPSAALTALSRPSPVGDCDGPEPRG